MGHERLNWTGCILIHPYNVRYRSYTIYMCAKSLNSFQGFGLKTVQHDQNYPW